MMVGPSKSCRPSSLNSLVGAAKVYTMRGKYKQYFLRITADGKSTSQPANLKVTAERTLEIVVEDVSGNIFSLFMGFLDCAPATEPACRRETVRFAHEWVSAPPSARAPHPGNRKHGVSVASSCVFAAKTVKPVQYK